MCRSVVSSIVALTILLLCAAPAFAIVNGEPDLNRHPNAGISIVTKSDAGYPNGLGQWIGCDGTLIAPTVFLTSGSCVLLMQEWIATGEIDEVVWVTFSSAIAWPPCSADPADVVDCPGAIRVTNLIPHPDLTVHGWNTGASGLPSATDLGVLLLENPVTDIAPAALPPLGYLDDQKAQNGLHGQPFNVVGYGITFIWNKAPSVSPPLRRVASSEFLALAPGDLVVSQNMARDDGGACRWDWGGPVLYGDPEVLVAIVSNTDRACRGIGIHFRLDIESSRQFLGQFVTLP